MKMDIPEYQCEYERQSPYEPDHFYNCQGPREHVGEHKDHSGITEGRWVKRVRCICCNSVIGYTEYVVSDNTVERTD